MNTEHFKAKNVTSLSKQCQQFILKFTHNLVWRTLDPPAVRCTDSFKPKRFQLNCQLPSPSHGEEKNSEEFRRKLKIIKSYFSENLVRPVYDKLTEKCQKFVTENLLQYGDIILQLIFQDGNIYRKIVFNFNLIFLRSLQKPFNNCQAHSVQAVVH